MLLPYLVGGIGEQSITTRAGVGAEDVNPAIFFLCGVNQGGHLGFVGDIAGHAVAADLCRCLSYCVCIQVREHDTGGTFLQKRFRHGFADAAATAGDDNNFIFEFHVPPIK